MIRKHRISTKKLGTRERWVGHRSALGASSHLGASDRQAASSRHRRCCRCCPNSLYTCCAACAGLCVVFALALAFLLYHYLAPRFASPSPSPSDDAASGWSVPRGPPVVVVQSPDAARLAETHRAKLEFEAELLAAQVRVPVAGQPGLTRQLDQFFDHGRLKEQEVAQSQRGLEALEAQGEAAGQLGQPQQIKDSVVAPVGELLGSVPVPAAVSPSDPTSPIPPATPAPADAPIPTIPVTLTRIRSKLVTL